MFTMYNNTQAFHGNKRKQDCSNFGGSNGLISTGEELCLKKQRLSLDQNDGEAQYNFNNITTNGVLQTNGHSQTSNGRIEIDGGHLQQLNGTNVEMGNGYNRISEPMECGDEQSKSEVNGNVTSNSDGKYCPHGHLNTCTTYNVPCRYPRMYCHPGGLLEDRLSIYHGF